MDPSTLLKTVLFNFWDTLSCFSFTRDCSFWLPFLEILQFTVFLPLEIPALSVQILPRTSSRIMTVCAKYLMGMTKLILSFLSLPCPLDLDIRLLIQ